MIKFIFLHFFILCALVSLWLNLWIIQVIISKNRVEFHLNYKTNETSTYSFDCSNIDNIL